MAGNNSSDSYTSEYITVSCACFRLKGPVLYALCRGQDGEYHISSIDLNAHYGNRNGSFTSKGSHFYNPNFADLDSISLRITPEKKMILRARLLNCNKQWKDAEIDISPCVLNRNGKLVFERHDGWFGRDGAVTKFLEKLPVIGYLVSLYHWITGDTEHAKRAAAKSTKSTIVTAGTLVGSLLGGPLGSFVGTGLATLLGIVVENFLKNLLDDPKLKAEFEGITAGGVALEVLANALVAGIVAGAVEAMAAHLSTVAQDATMAAGRTGSQLFGVAVRMCIMMLQMSPGEIMDDAQDISAEYWRKLIKEGKFDNKDD